MAVNIFDKYGIKEVANVYFEALDNEPKNGVYKGDIVLYLDSLKVSTIETTAENVAAQGGWGNPRLVQWDYGKEITVTLEDALLSLESLRFMLGGAIRKSTDTNEKIIVRHTEQVVANSSGWLPLPKSHISHEQMHPKAWPGHPIRFINLGGGTDSESAGARTQIKVSGNDTITMGRTSGTGDDMVFIGDEVKFFNPKLLGESASGFSVAPDDVVRIFWEEEVENTSGHDTKSAVEVVISPNTFPGTYRVVGDTYIRSALTGADEAFQFVIEKAKVSSEVTLTLEAEGDPATFEMTLNVLRSTGGEGDEMMKLIRYSVEGGGTTTGNDYGTLNGSGDQTDDEIHD